MPMTSRIAGCHLNQSKDETDEEGRLPEMEKTDELNKDKVGGDY